MKPFTITAVWCGISLFAHVSAKAELLNEIGLSVLGVAAFVLTLAVLSNKKFQ